MLSLYMILEKPLAKKQQKTGRKIPIKSDRLWQV
jgi:hypothetical protein